MTVPLSRGPTRAVSRVNNDIREAFNLIYIVSKGISIYMYANIFQEIMSIAECIKDLKMDTSFSRSYNRKFEYIIPKTQ